MKRFEWIPSLAMNVEPVDAHHKRLFELYNAACEAEDSTLDRDELIGQLLEYTQFHFSDEEELMETVGYPVEEMESHKLLHREFVLRLNQLQSAPMWELLDYFQEWLLRHIVAVDTKVGRFMKEHGSKPKK